MFVIETPIYIYIYIYIKGPEEIGARVAHGDGVAGTPLRPTPAMIMVTIIRIAI